MSMQFGELIVDLFAGGGGATTGIKMAKGRSADHALNHDRAALALHAAANPDTVHHEQDVWEAHPDSIGRGRPVGLLWFSPDCTHFSRAKGGKPRSTRTRSLAWVGVRWARVRKPRVMVMENVQEIRDWSPLLSDGTPDGSRKGVTFDHFVRQLKRLGYAVEHRLISAHQYGAPTTRKRLFLIARRDGMPIVWPQPTHGPNLEPYRTAAECIDWSLPCPSIFERSRPLADATLRRIARGVQRFVIDADQPFIIPDGAACMVQTGYGERDGQAPRTLDLEAPLGTIVAGGQKHGLVTAFLSRFFGNSIGRSVDEPIPTTTAGGGGKSALVAACIAKHYGGMTGHGVERPLGTVTAVDHHSLVTAFLTAYYGNAYERGVNEPTGTITCTDRFGLVVVEGAEYKITDIGMRMLQPRELFTAQGFPADYPIDIVVDGKRITKRDQVRLVGNSVSPPPAAALVGANFTDTSANEAAA